MKLHWHKASGFFFETIQSINTTQNPWLYAMGLLSLQLANPRTNLP